MFLAAQKVFSDGFPLQAVKCTGVGNKAQTKPRAAVAGSGHGTATASHTAGLWLGQGRPGRRHPATTAAKGSLFPCTAKRVSAHAWKVNLSFLLLNKSRQMPLSILLLRKEAEGQELHGVESRAIFLFAAKSTSLTLSAVLGQAFTLC